MEGQIESDREVKLVVLNRFAYDHENVPRYNGTTFSLNGISQYIDSHGLTYLHIRRAFEKNGVVMGLNQKGKPEITSRDTLDMGDTL